MKENNISPKLFLIKYSHILILAIIILSASVFSPSFIQEQNLMNILRQASMLLIMSLGMTCAMLLGRGVDMSIGATLSLSSCLAVQFLRTKDSMGSVFLGIAIALLVGLAVGVINGALIAYIHIPAFLATYGVREIIRSIAYYYMNGDVVTGFHKSINFMGSGFVFGVVPTQIIIAAILTIIMAFVLKRTKTGRELYIVGTNPEAANYAGISINKSIMTGFILSGVLAALAGIIYLGRLGAAEAEIGTTFHFQCVSAVAIGGISFSGGAGSAWGAVIGALILNVLINVMNLLNVSSYWQGTVNGVVILVAVLIDYAMRKQK